jgi:hypothetical protein
MLMRFPTVSLSSTSVLFYLLCLFSPCGVAVHHHQPTWSWRDGLHRREASLLLAEQAAALVQAMAFLTALTMALESTKADGQVRQLRLELQLQLVSLDVAACVAEMVDCCLLPLPDGSPQQLLVSSGRYTTPHQLHVSVLLSLGTHIGCQAVRCFHS